MSNRPLKNKKKVVVEEEMTAEEHEVEYRPPGRTSRDLVIQIGVAFLIISFILAPMLVFIFSDPPERVPQRNQQQQQQDDLEAQIANFSKELASKPDDPTVLTNLGLLTNQKADRMQGTAPGTPEDNKRMALLKESEGYLRKALEKDGKYALAQQELAKNLILQSNFEEAQTLIAGLLTEANSNLTSSDAKVAADAKGQKTQFLMLESIILSEKGDKPAAIAKLGEVIEVNPGAPEAYMQRGRLHAENNDKAAARKDFETLVDIGQKTGNQNAAMYGQLLLQELDKPLAPAPGATPGAAGTPTVITIPASGTPAPGAATPAAPVAATPAAPVAPATPSAPATP